MTLDCEWFSSMITKMWSNAVELRAPADDGVATAAPAAVTARVAAGTATNAALLLPERLPAVLSRRRDHGRGRGRWATSRDAGATPDRAAAAAPLHPTA